MIDGPRRTYINFKKVDWACYAEAFYKYLAKAGKTRTVEQAAKSFGNALSGQLRLTSVWPPMTLHYY